MHAAAFGSWRVDAPINLHIYPREDQPEGPERQGFSLLLLHALWVYVPHGCGATSRRLKVHTSRLCVYLQDHHNLFTGSFGRGSEVEKSHESSSYQAAETNDSIMCIAQTEVFDSRYPVWVIRTLYVLCTQLCLYCIVQVQLQYGYMAWYHTTFVTDTDRLFP